MRIQQAPAQWHLLRMTPPVFLVTACQGLALFTSTPSGERVAAFALGVGAFLICFPRFYIGDHEFLRRRDALRMPIASALPRRISRATGPRASGILRGGQWLLFALQSVLFVALAYYAAEPVPLCMTYVTLLCVNVVWLLLQVIDMMNDLVVHSWRDLLKVRIAGRNRVQSMSRRAWRRVALTRWLIGTALRWAGNNLVFIAVGTVLCLKIREIDNAPALVALLIVANSLGDYLWTWGVYKRGCRRTLLG